MVSHGYWPEIFTKAIYLFNLASGSVVHFQLVRTHFPGWVVFRPEPRRPPGGQVSLALCLTRAQEKAGGPVSSGKGLMGENVHSQVRNGKKGLCPWQSESFCPFDLSLGPTTQTPTVL